MVERNSPWIDSRGDVFMSALSGGVFVAGDRLKNFSHVVALPSTTDVTHSFTIENQMKQLTGKDRRISTAPASAVAAETDEC